MIFNYTLMNKILETICPLPENLGLIYLMEDESEEESEFFLSLKKKIRKLDSTAIIQYGASKIAISSKNLGDFVIKISFNGWFEEDEETKELYWNDFNGAAGSDSSDYCLTEYEKYCTLKEEGLGCFVAKTFYYKEIDDTHRIFLQEKVIPKNDMWYTLKPSLKSSKIAKELKKKEYFCIDTDWIANCIDIYGEQKVNKFLYYCNNIDIDILNDAHDGNFGYRKNGTPVILDYSNFNS